MQAFNALVHKDLLLFLKDRRALLMNLLAPIFIAAFFGYIFGGSGAPAKPTPIGVAVTDLDGSTLSQRVVAGLQADAGLAVQVLDADTAATLVRQGKLRAAVQLPAGFGVQAGRALFGAGPAPELVLVHDPSQSATLALVRGLLTQQVMQVVSEAAFAGTGATANDLKQQVGQAANLPTAQRAALLRLLDSAAQVQALEGAASAASSASSAPSAGLRQPFSLRLVEGTHTPKHSPKHSPKQGYNAYAHSFAGMGVQFILMLGVEMGVALLLLRRSDVWKRLRVAPLSPAVLLGSRTASTALIAFGLFAAIMAAGMLAFGVRVHGSWLGLVALLAAFSVMTASFGLMVAALGRTPEATRGLAILATLLMVMLGGAWVPSFLFPAWLQSVTLWIPTRWAVDGLDAMTWRGLGLEAALAPVAVLLAFSAVFALVAVWRFRWDEDRSAAH
jgi:ABC-2 type transport system permease protein